MWHGRQNNLNKFPWKQNKFTIFVQVETQKLLRWYIHLWLLISKKRHLQIEEVLRLVHGSVNSVTLKEIMT